VGIAHQSQLLRPVQGAAGGDQCRAGQGRMDDREVPGGIGDAIQPVRNVRAALQQDGKQHQSFHALCSLFASHPIGVGLAPERRLPRGVGNRTRLTALIRVASQPTSTATVNNVGTFIR
jgi:hypothetical protein